VTDTNHETRGFPPIEPIDAPPEMARFMSAMRRLQDIVVSTAPDGALWPFFFDWHFGLTSSPD
jgi:hypothetical protein